jgi:riboflavin synthase
MFTGIVYGRFPLTIVKYSKQALRLGVRVPEEFLHGIQIGASVAISGVCLTVVSIEKDELFFDVVEETLKRTTLGQAQKGEFVNIERSLRLGEEIGGHILSGHVMGTAEILEKKEGDTGAHLTVECPRDWMKYILPKGFIALDGCSLTVVDVDLRGSFTIALIPETLSRTTLGIKKAGDLLNVEIDPQTQLIVSTVERLLMAYQNSAKTLR